MTIKTIFLDRDGVINKEIGYLYKVEDFQFINGVFKACQYFNKLGYQIIIVTNQSGISRGYYSENDYQIITNWMLSEFKKKYINILDIFHCPHITESNCDCRKPKPGMFIKAQKKYNINMTESWMIGDSQRDIRAANSAGIKKTILVKNSHNINNENLSAMFIIDSINETKKIILE